MDRGNKKGEEGVQNFRDRPYTYRGRLFNIPFINFGKVPLGDIDTMDSFFRIEF